MIVTPEQLFEKKQQLQKEITEYEAKLQEHVKKQAKITKIEQMAKAVLEYVDIEDNISDRTKLFALFSSPPESLRRPMVKSQLFSYIEAAETIGPEMVDFIVNEFLDQVREDIAAGEDDDVELIEAEYKEYVIPGKIISEKFGEIDELLEEMIRFCRNIDPAYRPERAQEVLRYAFAKSIPADTRMEPTITALREVQFKHLTAEYRAELLDQVEEHLAVLRYDETKDLNVAMDKAVKMIEQKEEAEGKGGKD